MAYRKEFSQELSDECDPISRKTAIAFLKQYNFNCEEIPEIDGTHKGCYDIKATSSKEVRRIEVECKKVWKQKALDDSMYGNGNRTYYDVQLPARKWLKTKEYPIESLATHYFVFNNDYDRVFICGLNSLMSIEEYQLRIVNSIYQKNDVFARIPCKDGWFYMFDGQKWILDTKNNDFFKKLTSADI